MSVWWPAIVFPILSAVAHWAVVMYYERWKKW